MAHRNKRQARPQWTLRQTLPQHPAMAFPAMAHLPLMAKTAQPDFPFGFQVNHRPSKGL